MISILISGSLSVFAQWGPPYTNSWITYGKPYAKVVVSQKGIHKVPFAALPAGFPVDAPAKIQMWHRGKQVAIVSTANNEIVFYGVPNDGAIDSLLYRPMSGRLNPYTSLYSDESSYFLTIGDNNGLRAQVINQAADENIKLTAAHSQTDVTSFSNEYSLSTLSAIRADFFNSFFENGASKTGVTVLGGKVTNYNIQLVNRSVGASEKPIVKLMIHGRSNSSRVVEVSAGKTEQSLRLVHKIPNTNFTASIYSFPLEASDLNADGKAVISLKSVSTDTRDRYSLAYYTITYPQNVNMGANKSYTFNLKGASNGWAKLAVNNAPASSTVYDITDRDVPKLITGKITSLMVPVKTGANTELYVTSEAITVAKTSVTSLDLKRATPKDYNYIIITSENLREGADAYAKYRASAEGGSFKPLVADIKDIYNQFNFGEPSPVGIRRFMDYMLSDNSKDKHLFLIGKSIAFNERMVRELPNEVPTIGFPGSDLLLVEGLAGSPKETPAVPVGRLSALTNQHIYDYLDKVKEHETALDGDVSWQKNVLHLNGGKSAQEITQLKNILSGLAPLAEKGYTGAIVKPFVKQQGIGEVESVNITPEINSGVGLLTYFGHGSTTVTDLDIGYITDAARAYNNRGKYPLMYFNGCGVGNVFSGRFNPSPSASDRIALSLDWILAPKRGTVALIANTFDTYVSSTTKYLEQLYTAMFLDSEISKLSIGNVQKEVAKKIFATGYNSYDVGNVHQALLQGDPALHMISVNSPDYSLRPNESIFLSADAAGKTIEQSTSLKTALIIRNQGRYNKDEKVSVQIKYFYEDGKQDTKLQTIPAVSNLDTIYVLTPNKRNLNRVEAKIDPENLLVEISKANNSAELIVDWSVAKGQSLYPAEIVKDIVPPILNVFFDGRVIQNGEIVAANPEISFVLADDRFMPMDTALLEIFIKSCADNTCDFKRLNFTDIKLSQLTDRSFQATYASELQAGVYQLLVNSKDSQGATGLNAYQTQFNIMGSKMKISVVPSPNPASNYVRFHAEGYDARNLQTINYTIYDLSGNLRAEHLFTPSSAASDWYWKPEVTSGVYIYKAVVKQQGNGEATVSGKIVIAK
ncbi:C25 family cysteine peptidase [Dyadobacter sp. CY326]|uniref:putative type IX secretion system sortase PorU2 n=1 Tax=Dyadobacter sp. CY326 TaxID=2907300 RepID=UPI001F29C7BF|nr:C25 family cysteine peptidase [Dyadobacter sp. CY326]MCE7065320.1 C25 family cysteine peptidase [Dyadobacter sp. CY326]